jgi:hypothetical protein
MPATTIQTSALSSAPAHEATTFEGEICQCRVLAEPRSIINCFRAAGGVMTGDSFALLMRGRTEQPISLVARWIVEREIVNFTLGAHIMLPLFQFEMESLERKQGITNIVVELRDVLSDAELAEWFCAPSVWLGGQVPVVRAASDMDAVFQAARADRFAAFG